jgi:hypothetical protein
VRAIMQCKEDLTGDGVVDVFDVAHLSGPFGHIGPPGWIPDDLMPDGIIDNFDVSMVDRMFYWHSSASGFSLNSVTWSLDLQAYNANFTVDVYSDYIVHSKTYTFNDELKTFSFDIVSEIDGFCTVTIPRGLMSGNFTVYLDGVSIPFEYVSASDLINYVSLNFTSTASSNRVTIQSTTTGILGDVNRDGWVDIYDAILLANAYNSVPTSPNWNAHADVNGDGVVDIYDAIILAGHYSQHY